MIYGGCGSCLPFHSASSIWQVDSLLTLDIMFLDDELFALEPDWDEWENMMKEEYLK